MLRHLTVATSIPPSSRLDWLDALRGIAALLVVIYHISTDYSPVLRGTLQQYANLGKVAVIVFFLCSGYIIPRSLEQADLRTFWIRRIWRLFPLFWCSVLMIVVLAIAGLHAPVLPHVVLLNLSMIAGWLGVTQLNPDYWTLGLELAFYSMVSLLYYSRVWHRSIAVASLLILAALVVDGVMPLVSGVRVWNRPLTYLAVMWCGTVIERAERGLVTHRAALYVVAATVLVLLVPYSPPDWEETQALHYAMGLVIAGVAGMLIFGIAYVVREWHPPVLFIWLGQISYSLYLMHRTVLIMMPPLGGLLVTLLFNVSVSIALATLTYRWIEQPSIALGRRLTASHCAMPVSPLAVSVPLPPPYTHHQRDSIPVGNE